jgi:type VI protein secretion system component Hcp
VSLDIFLVIDVVEGPIAVKGFEHKGLGAAFEIYSFSFGASNPVEPNSTGGGGQNAGKLVFGELSIVMAANKGTAPLLLKLGQGKPFKSVQIVCLRKGDKAVEEAERYVFEYVLISSKQMSASSGGDNSSTVQVSFRYLKLTEKILFGATGPGKLGGEQYFWDSITNAGGGGKI